MAVPYTCIVLADYVSHYGSAHQCNLENLASNAGVCNEGGDNGNRKLL
jgi:hypothetical protein